MQSFLRQGQSPHRNPVREKSFGRAVPLATNFGGGRAFFGTLSPSQNRFHWFSFAPQHFLYFLPLPQGQGSLRPGLFSALA
mgnify:CR=1 FL=1